MFQAAKSWIKKLKANRLIIGEKLELKAETLTATDQVTVSLAKPLSIIDTTLGGMAGLTLADGYQGQVKVVLMTVDGANGAKDAVLTPDHFTDSYITFDAAGDIWTGIYYAAQWHTLSVEGASVS